MSAAERKVNRDGSIASGIGSGGHAHGFWNKVNKRDDGCWDWMGFLTKDGSGKFCTKGGRTLYAHRYAYEELVGPIPSPLVLLAIVCWNRRCVNPAHREPVRREDVTRYIHACGRPVEYADNKGAMSGRALLNDEKVLFIRAQARVRGAPPLLAKLYGVSVVTVRQVIYRRTWTHLRARKADNLGGVGVDVLRIDQLRELVAAREAKADLDGLAVARS